MTQRMTLFVVGMLLAALLAPAVSAKTPAELLREGLYAEDIEGNLDTAIGTYQKVVDDASAPRDLVAQALFRQGTCYMKKKQEQEAQVVFRKIVNNYSDQTEIVAKVRPMLEELGNADPASLMPPETMAYIEIGSPGAQVETILNMLKGTPLENPLEIIGAGGGHGNWGGGNNPAQMLGGLFNPSMLAEFKKIRGLGIGVMDVGPNGHPGVVAVLFPGQSDALRGILMAAIAITGRPAEPIEGMSAVTFPPGGGAAYDGTVVILATPSPKANDALQWSVKQYKSGGGEPSLASDNKSFTKISKQARQQNAVTVWVNVDQAYERLGTTLGPEKVPEQVQALNGLANLTNVDDLIVTLSLRETGVALEANVDFKDGTRSPLYGLMRTPSLNKAALQAIPADAVAVISVMLAGPDSAQAQALGAKIKAATGGQDLAPQIFGNIEQITLFAMPLKDAMQADTGGIPPIARSIGLAVSCKDAQQVQQLLTKVLQMAQAVPAPAEGQAGPTLPATGRFEIALTNGPKVFGHTDPASRTMVLSLNPQMVESSATAIEQDMSVTSGGKLQEALATLSSTTSKLVLVNVAGWIQLVAQNVKLPSDETAAQAREALDELIQACQKTTVRLQTSEEPNSINFRLSVSDLPPVHQIFGPAQRIAKLLQQSKASMSGASAKAQASLSVARAAEAPTIDGNPDPVWAGAASHKIDNVAYRAPDSETDLSACFETLYDDQALYFLIDVTDEKLINDSTDFWLDDAVEIFMDADNKRADSYGQDGYQYRFRWDSEEPAMAEALHQNTGGVQYALARTDKGYCVEVRFPWSTLGVKPAVGAKIGFDVHVNDDDDGGERDSKLMWCDVDDVVWENPHALGTGELAGLIGWWKLNEAEGAKAADSSGCGHDGTVHGGPTWQPAGGKIGGALKLDGVDDYVDTGYNADLATWTVAVWVKSPAAPANADASGPVHREKNFQINWNHPIDEFRGRAAVCADGEWHSGSFGELKGDTWYHLTAVFDGKSLNTYANGVLVTNDPDASGVPDAETETLKLGKHAQDDYHFAGTIDDVRLYNFALGERQVKQLYEGK